MQRSSVREQHPRDRPVDAARDGDPVPVHCPRPDTLPMRSAAGCRRVRARHERRHRVWDFYLEWTVQERQAVSGYVGDSLPPSH